jgi:hypothetical protein
MSINTRIEQFIKLRDLIKKENDEHAERMKAKTDLLKQLNNVILEHLNTAGVDSVAVRGVGTAYRNLKKSASIADGEEFKRFVIGTQAWDMLDWKANATQVADYVAVNNTAPPGVNFSTVVVVGVRRD